MLIDWCTWVLGEERIPPQFWDRLLSSGPHLMLYDSGTGIVEYDTPAWASVRSDTHNVVYRVGSRGLYMQGSPARCIGRADAVFGAGASSALDLAGCLSAMIRTLAVSFDADIRDYLFSVPVHFWRLTRIDITENLYLESLASVRCALGYLRSCEGGRYRVSQQAGDTVYWSHRSRLRSGKAYAKGPHLKYLMSKKGFAGCRYTTNEIEAAGHLLRLELKLGSLHFRRSIPWYNMSPRYLRDCWGDYFNRMIRGVPMDNDSVQDNLVSVAKTPAAGLAAYGCWLYISAHGWERARSNYSKSTWYRYIALFHAIGLSDSDIAVGRVIPMELSTAELRPCDSWSALFQFTRGD